MQKSIWIIVFLDYLLINFTDSVLVAQITKSSNVSFVDIWNSVNQTLNTDDYIREDLIDQWDDPNPHRVNIYFYDPLGRSMAMYTFNSTGSSMDILSWMTAERCQYSFPYPVISSTMGTISISNKTLYFKESGSEDKYFFVSGPHPDGSGNQMILNSKNGSSFTLNGENIQAGRKVFWQSNFTYNDFIEANSSIDLVTYSGGFHYVNGISVFNKGNQSVQYMVGYNSALGERCNVSYHRNISDSYNLTCDGSLVELPDMRVVCLWLYFSEAVDNFTVTLTESDCGFVSIHDMRIVTRYVSVEEPTTSLPAVTTESCACPCTQTQTIYANKTTEELEILLKETTDRLKKELSVDVDNLSSSIRKKTSASDSRPSATGVGVLGIILMVFLVTSLVLSDLGRMYLAIKELYHKFRQRKICRF